MPQAFLLSKKIANNKLKLARYNNQFILKKQNLTGIVSQFRLCQNVHP
jgi:hypothetical protein